MLTLLIGLVIGILIGWNWAPPQPAKDLQARVVAGVRALTKKTD